MRVVLLGPPGAGKGTLANLIKEKFEVTHISTGDIFREEMKAETPLGLELKSYVDTGKLVPDEVVTKIIENRLAKEQGGKGYMFDGFPRTKPQAEDLDRILVKLNKPLDYAVYMEATLPVIIQRLTGRRVCRECGALFHMTNKLPKVADTCDDCGGELYQRADDNETTIKTRMDEYLNNTAPIVEYYKKQGKLRTLDADKGSQSLLDGLIQIWNEDRK